MLFVSSRRGGGEAELEGEREKLLLEDKRVLHLYFQHVKSNISGLRNKL